MIRWSRPALGGTGFGNEGGSPSMADSEEMLRSGVLTCNDPLRGICCKARCRTAEETQKAIKERGQPCDQATSGGEKNNPTWVLEPCGWLSRSASMLVRESMSASILE